MEKEVKIQVPEGYVIDKENSTFECIRFKKKNNITFDTILKCYEKSQENFLISSTSYTHKLKLLAFNRLLYVAKYLNDGWVPDFNDIEQEKSIIIISNNNNIIISHSHALSNNYNLIYFKSAKLARQAIDILGEDTIRKALNVYY